MRGMMDSYEGVLSREGGATNRNWVTETSHAPFIWLANGGDYGDNDTLEIRIYEGGWEWGNLVCGDLTANGNLIPGGTTRELGVTGNPWNKVWSNYGYIGELTVTQNIYVDTIYGLTNVDLNIQPYSGKRIKVTGDFYATGDLTVDGNTHTGT